MSTHSLRLSLKQRPLEELNVSRTYLVEYGGDRLPHLHNYYGPASEAPIIAQRWLDSDPYALRVVSEAGDIIAEK